MQALKGEDITLYGDGQQTRSFCYVDDLVRGLMGLMDSADVITGPINIGNPGEFTIRQLAEQEIDLTGSKSKLVFMPLPQDDPKQSQTSIDKARAILDWEPRIALRDRVSRTIAYFDGMLTKKVAKLSGLPT